MARNCFALVALLGLGATALGGTPLQVALATPDAAGAGNVLDAGTPVAFGTTDVGTSVAKVFVVRNAGTEAVTLADRLKLPRGFTLTRRFGTNTLAPGQGTTFTLALNPAVAGPLGGPVTLSYQGSQAGKLLFAVAGTALGAPSVRIVQPNDAGFQTVGQWSAAPNGGQASPVKIAAAGSGANTATWTFTGLKPGQYQVAVSWTPGNPLASNARFTVQNGQVPFTAVPVNQKAAPVDFQDAGQGWKVLGPAYRITAKTLTVTLTDQANGAVAAGAVRIARVGFPGAILSPGDPGFRLTGAKLAATPGQGQGLNVVRLSSGGGQAVWTFTGLVPGQYRISTTWNENPKGATNSAYTVLDGNKALTTVQLDQRQAPADLSDAGRSWRDLGRLGTLYYVRSKTLVVALGLAGVNGPVDLGPIRVERIYNPGAPPPGGGPDGTSYADAVRFLEQSSWGPNDTEVNNVMAQGIADYLTSQLSATYTGFPLLPFPTNTAENPGCTCDKTVFTGQDLAQCNRLNYQPYPLQNALFANGLYGQDQLRQRMAWALHKIWVVSALDFPIPARMSYYLKVLDENALGNYYDIMYNMTLNPAMGNYLNMVNSSKGNPNENYAREVMQLFTIGLNQLNPDGTPILDDSGSPIPTYDQTTVVNFAKAFTGWTMPPPLDPINGNAVTNFRDPMVHRVGSHGESDYHDQTQKTLLRGEVIPAGQTTAQDLVSALNNIWNDPSLPPFVSKGLIQQLVTSNPSPEYVARVAQVFSDDGTGTQGNLAQVAVAILTDPEARGDAIPDPTYGKQREPVQLVLNLLRAFNATSYDGTNTSDGYLNASAGSYVGTASIGQDVLRPESVFSYFMPDWTLPGDASGLGLLGPEFQVFTTVNAYRRINMVNGLFFGSNGNNYGVLPSTGGNLQIPRGTRPNLAYLKSFNDNDPTNGPYQMTDYLNGLLLHGTMSDGMYGYLDGQGGGDGVVYAIYKVAQTNSTKRAQTAAYLVGSSSQYQVQR